MKTINGVLKKPAREADAFRSKLEETLEEVDRVRRDAAALKLTGLEAAARLLEDSLQELRSRGALSGSDFLPLAVKLDQLYGQFALLRSLSTQSGPLAEADEASPDTRMTENGTQIIEAPKFLAQMAKKAPASHKSATPKAHRMAPAGSLDSTLVGADRTGGAGVQEDRGAGLHRHPAGSSALSGDHQERCHSVDSQRRHARGRIVRRTHQRPASRPMGPCIWSSKPCPTRVSSCISRTTAAGSIRTRCAPPPVAKGLLNEEAASRLRDRQAIKLIFKSGYTTLESAPGEAPHGSGMSLVRRYVHEAGGKIALATLLGHETRFKVTLPAVAAADAQVA